jgi:hypothetical protein
MSGLYHDVLATHGVVFQGVGCTDVFHLRERVSDSICCLVARKLLELCYQKVPSVSSLNTYLLTYVLLTNMLCAVQHQMGPGWRSVGLVQLTSLLILLSYLMYHHAKQPPSQRTWTGWSSEMFQEWGMYIRVAIPSIVMICMRPATSTCISCALVTKPEQGVLLVGSRCAWHVSSPAGLKPLWGCFA